MSLRVWGSICRVLEQPPIRRQALEVLPEPDSSTRKRGLSGAARGLRRPDYRGDPSDPTRRRSATRQGPHSARIYLVFPNVDRETLPLDSSMRLQGAGGGAVLSEIHLIDQRAIR